MTTLPVHRVTSRRGATISRLVALAALAWPSAGAALHAQNYQRTDLVADAAGAGAANVDPHLVNGWGAARATGGPWWLSDAGTGLSTLYNGVGTPLSLVVTVPPNPASGSPTGLPSGIVFNGSADFALGPNQPAKFVFFTLDGTISGWNPQVNPTVAQIRFTAAANDPGVFSGGTIAENNGQRFLYVADFAGRRVRVFDANFQPVTTRARDFRDPFLSHRYSPFNVQNIGGNIFVNFARVGADGQSEDHGPGLGYAAVFSPRGRLLFRFQHGDWFNAPWGVVAAPSDFGTLSHRVLIGQFGSGQIATFDAVTGKFQGLLQGTDNNPVVIPGLWSLTFGDGSANSGPANSLYYAAGPNQEKSGLFGVLSPVKTDLTQGNAE